MTGRKPNPPRSLADRFWEYAVRAEGCWLWSGGRDKDGYGVVRRGGYPIRAHRASWAIHNGVIGHGMLVLHRCDEPACVNPDHLFLGTQRDNIRDAMTKRRHAVGRLTSEQVQQIVAMRKAGKKVVEIAAAVGCHQSNISKILHGVTWTDITGMEKSVAQPLR